VASSLKGRFGQNKTDFKGEKIRPIVGRATRQLIPSSKIAVVLIIVHCGNLGAQDYYNGMLAKCALLRPEHMALPTALVMDSCEPVWQNRLIAVP